MVLEKNKTTAKAVEDKINRIGEVKYTETCKVSIDDARAEYERLTDEQKKLVSNYYILLEAEQKYEYMKKEAEEIRRSSNSSVTQIQSNESGASLNVLSSGTEKIYRVGKYNYKVISSRTKTMAVIGVNTKTMKTIKISNKVKISGITYRVIEISPSAFKGCKRVKSVIIGKSVKKIGNKAFRGCKKLKKVVIKSKMLKKIGRQAFHGIYKRAVFKVPVRKLVVYKEFLKGRHLVGA